MKQITFTDYLERFYNEFWREQNKSTNAFAPEEGLKRIERKILFAAYDIKMAVDREEMTRKLASAAAVFHVAGDASIQDTVRSMGDPQRRPPECTFLNLVGNALAAARYTHVTLSPLGKKVCDEIPFMNWEKDEDDSGVEQVSTIALPLPIALVRGFTGIGVGRACCIPEYPHDEMFEWVRKCVDAVYPDSSGSGFNKEFVKRATEKKCLKPEDIRSLDVSDLVNKYYPDIPTSTYAELDKDVPEPYDRTGCLTRWDENKKFLYYKARMENIPELGRDIVTALPPRVSAKVVIAKARKKFGDKVANSIIDMSGKGYPIALKLPRVIAKDESCWGALSMKSGITRAITIWDDEIDTVHIIKYLSPIAIKWYNIREQLVVKKYYHKIASKNRQIYNNNLIVEYYKYSQAGKIKTEADVQKLFPEDYAYLWGLPEKTYIKENIDKIKDKNKKLEEEIAESNNKILNVKETVFEEWKEIADENVKFFKAEPSSRNTIQKL